MIIVEDWKKVTLWAVLLIACLGAWGVLISLIMGWMLTR